MGELGAHDADWEHVTVRLSPDGSRVLGIYYSAHRWRPPLLRFEAARIIYAHYFMPEQGKIQYS